MKSEHRHHEPEDSQLSIPLADLSKQEEEGSTGTAGNEQQQQQDEADLGSSGSCNVQNTVQSGPKKGKKEAAGDSTKKRTKSECKKAKKANKVNKSKNGKGSKKRGGVKSKPIKVLTHPLDRSIGLVFVVTLFFTLLAIASGLPIVMLLCLFLPLGLLTKRFLSLQWRALPTALVALTSMENFWLEAKTKNNNKAGCTMVLLHLDKELKLPQLRDVIMARIVQKTEYQRFRSTLVFRGKPNSHLPSHLRCKCTCRQHYNIRTLYD